MTTGNKEWAIGRMALRAFASNGDTYAAWQHRDGSDCWSVIAPGVSAPRGFVKRFEAFNIGHGIVRLLEIDSR